MGWAGCARAQDGRGCAGCGRAVSCGVCGRRRWRRRRSSGCSGFRGRCGSPMRRGRLGTGLRVRARRRGSRARSRRRRRSRVRRATGSRPIVATRSGWRGCCGLGELVAVRVPEPHEEAARDLVRAREDARGDLMRARHRLSKLLLRHGLVYDASRVDARPRRLAAPAALRESAARARVRGVLRRPRCRRRRAATRSTGRSSSSRRSRRSPRSSAGSAACAASRR